MKGGEEDRLGKGVRAVWISPAGRLHARERCNSNSQNSGTRGIEITEETYAAFLEARMVCHCLLEAWGRRPWGGRGGERWAPWVPWPPVTEDVDHMPIYKCCEHCPPIGPEFGHHTPCDALGCTTGTELMEKESESE